MRAGRVGRPAIGRAMLVLSMVAVMVLGGLTAYILSNYGSAPTTNTASSTSQSGTRTSAPPTTASSAGTPTATITTGTTVSSLTSTVSSSASTVTTSSTSTIQYNLTAVPLVWFAPLPPMPERAGREYQGSVDFYSLFGPSAPWQQAAGHVEVFKLYAEWLSDANSSQIADVVNGLNSRGIAIAIEAAALTASPGSCGYGIEGFWGANQMIPLIDKVVQAGGKVSFIAMDEPYFFASLYTGAGACGWTAAQVAQGVASFISQVHAAFPGVVVGDIEPWVSGVTLSEYEGWLAAAQQAAGSPLPFIQLDVQWSLAGWDQSLLQLQSYAEGHGVKFGMIYNGDVQDLTDRAWITAAESHFVTYEARDGGRPDYVIFQSWNDKPDYTMPETQNYTFTNLILRYFRTRTSMTLALSPGQGGALTATGTLQAAGGMPGATVEFLATPTTGPGVRANYTLTGTVPAGVATVDVGFRVNTECGCDGNSTFNLYGVSFALGGGGNLVPNPDFASGIQGWAKWGNATVGLEASDSGAGSMFTLQAAPDQYEGMNSGAAAVTPGSNYTATFDAKVSPDSVGSGYFVVVFLSSTSTEVGRQTVLFAPGTVQVGSSTTDANGRFAATLQGIPAGSEVAVVAEFAGSEAYWPAFAAATTTA